MEEVEMDVYGVSKPLAVTACTSMAVFYVAVLYFPTLIFRLPPSSSVQFFLIRRFFCAAISSAVSIFVCALILPVKNWETLHLLGVYGIRVDYIWQAVVFPLSLTSLMYAGSLVLKFLILVDSWKENQSCTFNSLIHLPERLLGWIVSCASNVMVWRNYIVAPLTEEIVFRACMIPLLICAGFRTYAIIFLSPIFFSLGNHVFSIRDFISIFSFKVILISAHLNHLYELCSQQNYSLLEAFMVVGLQLCYTVVFGSYASFLFLRTGHLAAPVVAHIFCNFMGLPVLFSRRNGIVTVAFISGVVGFIWLLLPFTRPGLYNDSTENCRCWHGCCIWK